MLRNEHMFQEGSVPSERHANNREGDYLNEAEGRFAAFIEKRERAMEDLDPLLEVIESTLVSDDARRRVYEAINALGAIGYESFYESVADQRRHEIEERVLRRLEATRDPEELELKQRLHTIRFNRRRDQKTSGLSS